MSVYVRSVGVSYVIGFVVIAGFATLRLLDPVPLESLRLKIFDFYQQLKPRDATEAPVVIVDIDEASLRKYGQWPWPRTRLAELVTKLTDMGAVAIAIDAVFAEEDRLSPRWFVEEHPTISTEVRAQLLRLPSNDQTFANAIRRSRVVLGQSGVRADVDVNGSFLPQTSIAFMGENPLRHLIRFPQLLRNVPILEKAAAGRGVFTLRQEHDGIVRRLPAVLAAQGQVMPSLVVDLLRVANGQATILIKSNPSGIESVVIGDIEIPTDERGQLWVYFGKYDPSKYVSVGEVMEGMIDPKKIANKLVVIGTSAIGLLDLRATPLEGALPGVDVQAQMLETILAGEQLIRLDYATGLEILLALMASLLILALAPRLRPLAVAWLGVSVAAALLVLSWLLFDSHRILIDVTYPVLCSFTVFASVAFYNYTREERERRWIRNAFGRYLAPQVVSRLASAPEQLELGGDSRELTVMFTDVRGFTGISEDYRDDPKALTQLMNGFLTPLSNAIIEHEGTIDKYMGDAIMAFWNAPVTTLEHHRRACTAALEMRRRLEQFNTKRAFRDSNWRRIEIGIGVNSGSCVVGNMGSELRFDYSALGDPVNLASRIEGLTGQYSVHVLVGSNTREACGEAFAFVEVDRIRVVGKRQPETIFALLGGAELAIDPKFQKLRVTVGEMLTSLRAQDWEEASNQLLAARSLDSEGLLSRYLDIMLERLEELKTAELPSDWDGVYMAHQKK